LNRLPTPVRATNPDETTPCESNATVAGEAVPDIRRPWLYLRAMPANASPELRALIRKWNYALENPRPPGQPLRRWKHRELVMLGLVPQYALSAKGRALRCQKSYERRQRELLAEQRARSEGRS
jgi:hypothetical protein